ncbi:MAG: hypothetical protein WBV94_33620 [Blastocatellia bacterium]
MPKQVIVEAIQPDEDGPVFGKVSDPADFMKSQIFAHHHAEINARDFFIGKCATRAVVGFVLSLPGGMQLRVLAPGQVVDVDGKSYELIDSSVDLTLEGADTELSRIDIVVAVLEEVETADELRPFQRLRTQDELDDAVAAYPPQQFNQPTEKHTRATIVVKTGEAAPQPVVPTTDADETPLYALRILPSATQIDGASVVDLRHLVASNCELQDLIEDLSDQLDNPPAKHRHEADEVDVDGNSPAFKLGATVQDALDTLALRTDETSPDTTGAALALRPEILRPDVAAYNVASGKLGSSGALQSAVPVVRIPYPRQVEFSTGRFTLDPNAFLDKTLNPRLINSDPDAGDNTIEHVVDYSLGSIEIIQTTGGGAWTLQGVQLPDNRARSYAGQRMAAPRDGRYIEVMGGAPLAGDSAWFTIDTLNGTITQKEFTGDIPNFYIRGVFPTGDGVNVIVAEQPGADGGQNGTKLKWYKVNCDTGASTHITGTAPGWTEDDTLSGNTSGVIGDLIAPNIIFLLIKVDGLAGSAGEGKAWIYHCDTGTFEQISPIGQNQVNGPLAGLQLNQILQDVDVCCYKSGQAVLVRGIGTQTWIFDYPTRSWTRLQIAQPVGDLKTWSNDRLWGVTLANINGRVQLTSEASSLWELTPSNVAGWQNIGLPSGLGDGLTGRGFPGLIGMLVDGLPRGTGWLIGGRLSNKPKQDIWKFAAGGIIETVFEGAPALTLGPGTKSATFRVANFQLPWQVAQMLITLRGANLQGRVKIVESFDNGAHLQEIPVNATTEILNSNSNPNRQLLITLIGTDAVKPIIAQSHETFEQEGGVGLGMVYLIYDCPVGTTYLFMNDKGQITSEAGAKETTKSKALLLRATKNGSLAPTTFDFINKPRIERKYQGGPKSGGVDPSFANDFSVTPDFIQCWLVDADGIVHLLTDCTVVFNGNNTVTGLANGQSYRVHLAG